MFVRTFLPSMSRPDADAIENLGMPVIVDQRRLGGGSHSTVGTITDIAPVLRLLFSRLGQPHVGSANLFSFNDPSGMCPECKGIGRKLSLNLDAALDLNKSLAEGAILLPDYGADGWYTDQVIHMGPFDPGKKLADFSKKEMDRLLYAEPEKLKVSMGGKSVNLTVQGIVTQFNHKYVSRDLKAYSARTQKRLEPFLGMAPCPLCKGARLSQQALGCTVEGYNIAELSALQVSELLGVIKTFKNAAAAPLIRTLTERLKHLNDIGLEYLSLDRETDTLSGGESARVKMVKHLSGSLVDVMYVFDEPSVGLHPHDIHRLNGLLQELRDQGNTVMVVEHEPEVMRVADHIVDIGPKAGKAGGRIVFEGSFSGLQQADTLTGRHLQSRSRPKATFREPTGSLPIQHARLNNLKNLSVDIPAGVLTVVTGVAGSGKSSLIEVFVRQHPETVVIDQSAVGTSSRSNPATYTGIMDEVRKAFAEANGVKPALFSFNSKGACENCQGAGFVSINLSFLEDIRLVCEVCEGKRYKEEVLGYGYNGKSITEVLDMTMAEALAFFDLEEVSRKLQALHDVGLDYLTLGQPLSTLSGGECQRIKLASELHKEGSVYIMDEPTTGLHMSDIEHFLALIDRLVDAGNTVVIIEHNQDVIQHADWVIDLGPEGGTKGGEIVFAGTPKNLLGAKDSLTARYLRKTSRQP
jgi:excinuclease UvrABC ATPase subunit